MNTEPAAASFEKGGGAKWAGEPVSKRKHKKPIASENLDENGDYIVGKNRTPVATRFQPGQSGNPAGKKGGTRNLDGLVVDLFFEKITVTTSRGPKTMSQAEALFRKLYELAMKGDHRATKSLLEMLRHALERREKAGDTESEGLSPAELAMLDSLLATMAPRGSGAGDRAAQDKPDLGEGGEP